METGTCLLTLVSQASLPLGQIDRFPGYNDNRCICLIFFNRWHILCECITTILAIYSLVYCVERNDSKARFDQ